MKPQIIIQLNVVNYDKKLKNLLLNRLNKIVKKKYDNQLSIKFSNAQKYWKYPGITECFFEIYSKKGIAVRELIKLFDVEWLFKCSSSRNVDTKKRVFNDESAIWNLYSHGGTLIDKNIEWAHIYT